MSGISQALLLARRASVDRRKSTRASIQVQCGSKDDLPLAEPMKMLSVFVSVDC